MTPSNMKLVLMTLQLMALEALAVRKSPSDIPKGSLSHGKCRFIINEISFYPGGSKQFLKLKRSCEDKPGKIMRTSMKNFRIIFFTHHAKLIGTCQPGITKFSEYATTREGSLIFYTIGGEDIAGKDMAIQDCHFASDYENFQERRFPMGSYPVAVGLLYNADTNVINGVELEIDQMTNRHITTDIRYSMEQVIIKNLQDLYVVVSSSPYTGCKYFQKYFSGYTIESNCFLRDWGNINSHIQQTLSRCKVTSLEDAAVDWNPFESENFRLTKSSPGSNNICEGGIRFLIEDSQPTRKKPRLDFGHEYSCRISTEDAAIEMYDMITSPLTYQRKLHEAIKESPTLAKQLLHQSPAAEEPPFPVEQFHSEVSAVLTPNFGVDYSDYFNLDELNTLAMQQPSSVTPEQPSAIASAHIMESINVAATSQTPNPKNAEDMEQTSLDNEGNPESMCKSPQPLTREDFENILQQKSPFIWKDCNRFEPKAFLHAVRAHPQTAPINGDYVNDPKVCSWLEWLPSQKKFRCKWCHQLWNQQVIFDSKIHITKLIKEGQGYLKGSHAKFDNKKLLEKHLNSDLHKLSEEFLRLHDDGNRGQDLKKAFEAAEGPYRRFLNKTEARFVSVFQAIKIDIPFLKYPMLSELVRHFGVDMGSLYNTRQGMKQISMAISKKMHNDFCNFLKSAEPEMSILLDTSSDVSSTYSLAIIFQTFDANHNVGTVFYRLVHVSKRETTENLYQLLIQTLIEDGLLDYVKRKMIGFGTDGGANVRKLKELLNKITSHDLIYVYCHAHRLERAVKHAWDGEQVLNDADALVNSLYTTFNSRSPKKKMILQQKIKDLSDSRFELKPIKKIRWVNSKKRATETVIRHWKTITEAVQSVQLDKTFPAKQRLSAEVLENQLKDPSIIATLAFVADASKELAKISLNLQKYGTTLIGKKGTREEIKNGLKSLDDVTGSSIKWLLSSSHLKGSITEGVKLVDFDTQVVVLEGIELKLSSCPRIGDIFSSYIDSLVREIDISFPKDVTDNFDIFNAKAWPRHDLDNFGNAELLELNSGLTWKFPPDELVANWIALKKKVTNTADFELLKEKNAEVFWGSYLKQTSLWTPELREIVTKVLTVPASTAEVERIYSFYTSTKTMRRYNLDVTSVDAIIRIKVNGDKTVQDFSSKAHEFVKEFILDGHLRSDDHPEKVSETDSPQLLPQIEEIQSSPSISIDDANYYQEDLSSESLSVREEEGLSS